jgi:hypothetical protein
MGEYAYYHGERVKIGTCEDMLYLRWDQRHLVTKSETPLFDEKVLAQIRFRFPWPEEDNIEPGGFRDPFRALRLDYEQPKDMDHGSLQFHGTGGYLVNLPCPEANPIINGYGGRLITIGKNGYEGPAQLIGQAWRGGRLVGIAQCNGCRYPYRLEDGYEEAAAVAIRSAADRDNPEGHRNRLHEIADRLLAGYSVKATA